MTEGNERVCVDAAEVYHSELECEAYQPPARAHVNIPRETADAEGKRPCPRCVDRLSGRWRRRGLLAAIGAGAAGLVGLAPAAHAEATLDATLELRDWSGDDTLIHSLTLGITNHEAEPIAPVVIPWGRARQSQLPWAHDSDPIPPGATGEVVARDPGADTDDAQSTALIQGYQNTVRVYDRGSEARAALQFRVGDPP
jgi:hypothetical protein